MTTPAITLTVSATQDDITRCLRESLVIASSYELTSLAQTQAEVEEHYKLQLAQLVTPEVRRQTVHDVVSPGLSEAQQLAISDTTVLAVFHDLVKNGVIGLAIA